MDKKRPTPGSQRVAGGCCTGLEQAPNARPKTPTKASARAIPRFFTPDLWPSDASCPR